ncbi:hypothetical protein Ahy_Scaffold6g108134 [Arachis hypogaea]|uniref:TFIIS-type domain-containing protein n=1 Tax=Arachis hypogaea TaxID=3818 RepID=A0A444WPF1_ARAHY|nr:hypothetical protein Ahy_Scaffold6g108134 [Arachis hypogaea]
MSSSSSRFNGKMGGLKFCTKCNNILYPKEDKELKILMDACRNCDHEEIAHSNIVYRTKIHHSTAENTQATENLAADPTLPRTKAARCSQCNHGEAVFFQEFWEQPEVKKKCVFFSFAATRIAVTDGETEAAQFKFHIGLKIKFESNNILYPKEDREQKILLYACRNCDHQEVADNNCVYRNEVHHSVGERTQVLQDVAADPTLPRTKAVRCVQCNHGEAVFFQATARGEEGMTLFFVCCNPNCGYRWRD